MLFLDFIRFSPCRLLFLFCTHLICASPPCSLLSSSYLTLPISLAHPLCPSPSLTLSIRLPCSLSPLSLSLSVESSKILPVYALAKDTAGGRAAKVPCILLLIFIFLLLDYTTLHASYRFLNCLKSSSVSQQSSGNMAAASAAVHARPSALKCIIYDVVYLTGRDMYAYSASDHAIR
jgi:hypothetical protein